MNEYTYYYLFFYDDSYITGFTTEADAGNYDFYGHMSDYPEVINSFDFGGWFKFKNGKFIEDSVRKAEMIAKKEKEATWQETIEAQVTYTAMMTDTLIEAEV